MIRTEDSFQAPNNRIIEEDEDEGWLCASNPPFVEPFTGTSEVTIDLSDDPTPSKFFKFFLYWRNNSGLGAPNKSVRTEQDGCYA